MHTLMFIIDLRPVVSLSIDSTSVIVKLSHLAGSLPPDMYNISAAPVNSERQTCQSIEEDLITVTTKNVSVEIMGLLEYRLYNLTVIAISTTPEVSNSTSVEFRTSTASKFFLM